MPVTASNSGRHASPPGEEYPCQYLPLYGQQIRLFTVEPGIYGDKLVCQIQTVDLAENPIFEALSYCWGDRLDVRDILVDGRLRSVTKNLHAALQRLRYEDRSRQVWADAICINQADDIEKTHQVNMMKNIFTQATSTTLFIGDYEADAREPMDYPPFSKDIKPDSRAGVETACALIRKLAENKHIYYLDWENDPLYLPSNSFRIWYHATECIRSLVMQPWWSRIWTVQETVLPAKPTVQYGAITLSWKLFGQAVDNLLGHFDRRCCNMKARPIVSEEPPIVTFYNKACSIERRRSQPLPLSTTLSLFRDRIASDPRDKVYGVLGLARDEAVRAGIEADYTIGPVDSYIQVTRKLIQQQDDLSPLGQVQHFHGEHLAGLPSWTPDFLSVGDWGYYSLALTYSHAYWKPLDFTRFRLDSGEDASVLKVSGIVFDDIITLGDTITPCPRADMLTVFNKWIDLLRSLGYWESAYPTGEGTYEDNMWMILTFRPTLWPSPHFSHIVIDFNPPKHQEYTRPQHHEFLSHEAIL